MKLIWAFLLTFLLFLPHPFNFNPVGVSGITELTQEHGHLYFAEGNFREDERKEEIPYQFQSAVVLISIHLYKQHDHQSFLGIDYSNWHGLVFYRKAYHLHTPHRGPPAPFFFA